MSRTAKPVLLYDGTSSGLSARRYGMRFRTSTGGMQTKLRAARLATAQGTNTIIANGKNPSVLYDITEGREFVRTLFKGK